MMLFFTPLKGLGGDHYCIYNPSSFHSSLALIQLQDWSSKLNCHSNHTGYNQVTLSTLGKQCAHPLERPLIHQLCQLMNGLTLAAKMKAFFFLIGNCSDKKCNLKHTVTVQNYSFSLSIQAREVLIWIASQYQYQEATE